VNLSAVFFLVAAAAAASGADPPPTPPPAASFQKIAPGGATGCATGAPFSFFYRAGSVNKVVVEFQGGGACWSAATCAAPLFTTTAAPPKEDDQGIHSNTDARNPFRGWHHMFVPYCTGDIFAGNKTTEYQGASGNKFAIRHFGRANAQAALNYVFANAPQNPDVVATVGCSAGSLGGYINGPYVFDRYPKSRRFYFGDSFVGVMSTSQFRDGLENWDLQFSPTVTGLDRASLEEVANDPRPSTPACTSSARLSRRTRSSSLPATHLQAMASSPGFSRPAGASVSGTRACESSSRRFVPVSPTSTPPLFPRATATAGRRTMACIRSRVTRSNCRTGSQASSRGRRARGTWIVLVPGKGSVHPQLVQREPRPLRRRPPRSRRNATTQVLAGEERPDSFSFWKYSPPYLSQCRDDIFAYTSWAPRPTNAWSSSTSRALERQEIDDSVRMQRLASLIEETSPILPPTVERRCDRQLVLLLRLSVDVGRLQHHGHKVLVQTSSASIERIFSQVKRMLASVGGEHLGGQP
jgi:hypothetical protein